VFFWGDVLTLSRRQVPGFVEHERGFWRTLKAAMVTWAWAAWPPAFWSRVRLEVNLRPWKALLWLALAIGVGRGLAGLCGGAARVWMMGTVRGPTAAGEALAAALSGMLTPWIELGYGAWVSNPGVAWLVRSGAWGLRLAPYGVPKYALGLVLLHGSFFATLLGLPETRRRAKVRAGHIVRGAAFGLAPVALLSWLATVEAVSLLGVVLARSRNYNSLPTSIAWWIERGLDRGWPLTFLVLWAWTVWWWRCAVRSYRLEQEREVLRVLWVMAVLVGAIVYGPALVGYLDSGVY
jgi:hypothetical protein